MAGTFMRRTSDLMRRVGTGKIEASVRVDQVYAQFQHQTPNLIHRGGGHAFYLTDPLIKNFPKWYEFVARDLYEDKMTTIFRDIAEDMALHVDNNAPAFENTLALSGEPRVKDQGKFVFRGPHEKRLTKTQLKAKTKRWNAYYRALGTYK